MLTFARKTPDDSVVNDQNDFQDTPLATQSLLLMLVLVHHWTTQSNPYISSLFSCLDSQGMVIYNGFNYSRTTFVTIVWDSYKSLYSNEYFHSKYNSLHLAFTTCIFSAQDPVQPTQTVSLFKIDFNLLYVTMCKKATGDSATLLLYLLLHRNPSFKQFLLKRTDLDQLVWHSFIQFIFTYIFFISFYFR